jgi:hypothetical protein
MVDLILKERVSKFLNKHFVGFETDINAFSSLYMLQEYLQEINDFFLLYVFDSMVSGVHDDGPDTRGVNSILSRKDGVDHVIENVTELDVVYFSEH